MGFQQVLGVLVTVFKVIKEQFFGNIDFGGAVKKHPVAAFLVLTNCILFALIIFLTNRALILNENLSTTKELTTKLQAQFVLLVPPDTPEDQIGIVITQSVYQKDIAHRRCLAELDAATKLLLTQPLSDTDKLQLFHNKSP